MKVQSKLVVVFLAIVMIAMAFSGFTPDNEETVSATETYEDYDNDGRPDQFEMEQGLNGNEDDVEWTIMVYVCADDEDGAPGLQCSSIISEAWAFIEKLSWVGCTDNITIVVQFDGSDAVNSFHQDQFWHQIPNNVQRNINPTGTSTRRFLVGNDSSRIFTGSSTSDCYFDTITSLFDVTDWPPGDPRTHGVDWEANMASPYTLHEFIDWGMDTFPSDNYCLYVQSHGGGIEGFGVDYRPDVAPTTSTMDVMNLSEIQILTSLMEDEEPDKKLDLTIMDSCFMGILDFCMEFSEFTDYYIGSENIMDIHGNQDDVVFGNLESNPDWSPQRLGQEYIDVLWNYSRDGSTQNNPYNIPDWRNQSIGMTLACMNCTFLSNSGLLENMTVMNQEIINGIGINPSHYKTILYLASLSNLTDWYPNNWIDYISRPINTSTFPDYTQIDYYHFVQSWIPAYGYPNDGIFIKILNAAINITEILWNNSARDNRGIEFEKHDEGYCNFTQTQGIAVYCPPTSPFLKTPYNYRNSKIGSTYWDEIIWWITDIREERGI